MRKLTPAQEIKKAQAKAEREALEREFALQCRQFNLTPTPQYEIAHHDWVYDFAFPESRILIEINGGTWQKGGHSSGSGIQRDYHKASDATLAGWHPLLFTADDVHSGRAILTTRQALIVFPPF